MKKGWKQIKEEKSKLTDNEKKVQLIIKGFDIIERKITYYLEETK